MRFPFALTYQLSKYLVKKKLKGEKIFPLVLMLEPLHACNLECIGCGRIREYKDVINEKLTLEECLNAVDECNAPVVSICGGEPLMYSQIGELVEEIVKRKKHVYLCTNGILLAKTLNKFKPSNYLSINIHIDGTKETHDLIVDKNGVYDKAIEAIKLAKNAGFLVCTNTTIYKETDINDTIRLFDVLDNLNIDGILVSPAYEYEVIPEKIFLNKQEIHDKFKIIDSYTKNYRFYSTPIYMKFLRGEKKLDCTPWGNVTRNVKGWKAPCYLITDKHFNNFNAFTNEVQWDKYGPGRDPRCANCMVHSGFEASVALGKNNSFSEFLQLAKWNMF
ncbi:MAG: adenosyl-hopene transferase HpnH [Spirochaetota bacterium]|nr:adenosyl-hopene transferase HpnH [Spirochaetota bacterium]